MQKKNIECHYLFSGVKIRKFSKKLSDEVIAIKCDDMNKLNSGSGMMVNQYYQIRGIYLEEDSPDYEDQNFNLPWHKIIPIRYMILEFKGNFPVQHQESSHCSYRDVNGTIGDTDNNFY